MNETHARVRMNEQSRLHGRRVNVALIGVATVVVLAGCAVLSQSSAAGPFRVGRNGKRCGEWACHGHDRQFCQRWMGSGI